MSVKETVEAIYAAYRARDLDGTLALMSKTMRYEWPYDATNPLCGCCHGRDAMAERLMALGADFEFHNFEVDDLIVVGDRAAARITMTLTSKKSGAPLINRGAHFWRFEDGKAVELIEHYDTALLATHAGDACHMLPAA